MKLKTVTDKDWDKWHSVFHAEIAEEELKLNREILEDIINKSENISLNEWFEWDGTSTINE